MPMGSRATRSTKATRRWSRPQQERTSSRMTTGPVDSTGLVVADDELILSTSDATQAELEAIVECLNAPVASAKVYVVMEQNDDGVGGKVFGSRVGAEQHLREVLAEYESAGDPLFTEDEIEQEIARISVNPEQAEPIEAADLGTLWIDECDVHP